MINKLSIIIPVYNAEKYLSTCIESVLIQTVHNFELILINDGSTDTSGNICKHYAAQDSRVKVIHQANCGVSGARNKGLEVCTGQFVTFIDADDVIQPKYLANFSYNDNIDFEIQGFILNYVEHEEQNVHIKPSKTRITSLYDVYSEAELQKTSRGPCCKLLKTHIIKENKLIFPTGISFGEDAIFIKRYILHCTSQARAIATTDYLYNHYDNSSSLTHRKHSAIAIYSAAWEDYQLFIKLEDKLGDMPAVLKYDFTRIRSLEFYLSIVNCMTEHNQIFNDKRVFLQKAQSEMFQAIKSFTALPPTYKIIRLLLLYFPIGMATRILNLLYLRKT